MPSINVSEAGSATISGQPERLSIAIGIATRGRPAILHETLVDLSRQAHRPEKILVAYCEPSDIGDAPAQFPEVSFIQGSSGSCAQRNHLLHAAGTSWDLIFFMDDDFYLHRDYLRRMEEVFLRFPKVQGATGKVVADGAVGPGLTVAQALATIQEIPSVPTLDEQAPTPVFNTYGCNMIFRLGTIQQHGTRFDENLPAYAWFEDIDFSRRLLPYGTLVEVAGAQGVHLGVKVGRTSGKRLGYSQVANPIYLAQKGTMSWWRAINSIGRRVLSNLLRSIAPEPYLDRRGRMRGNLLAFRELFSGRLRPDRILSMQ